MTTDEQQRADHLALVAATVFAAFWPFIRDESHRVKGEAMGAALDIAHELQRAAEERVVKP